MGALHFVLALAGCAVMCGGVWLTVKSIRLDARRAGPGPAPSADLDAYELAFLAGGPSRVAETAAAVLITAEALRLDRRGDLHAVAGAAEPAADVERALFTAVRARPGGMDAGRALRTVARGSEVAGLRRRLVSTGLVHRPSGIGPVRAKLALLLAVPVLAWGMAAAGAVASVLAPDGFTGLSTLAMAATGVVGFTRHAGERRALRDAPTWAGRQVLERYGRETLTASQERLGPAIPVALHGLDGRDEPRFTELARSSRRQKAPVSSGAAACGSHGDSGGGDGGGSGCGGGGCGGGG
ncbi:TIGR04222 domain-containing membrane protein [Nonomuraea ferruginea]|uniref:TIGR04222 domain-containing membrane protein n=1 Tax=Nonomuraea ferruginea TaxID=46174 RepID=A0ABT4SUW4_9ACTN|nr:TIGR04222 domain-containing membrane protein [Nonomuraea ferruginea]MDA0640631.1 TIGR04222 domain-containing membrane protein [Nonomuraea ferruginea]